MRDGFTAHPSISHTTPDLYKMDLPQILARLELLRSDLDDVYEFSFLNAYKFVLITNGVSKTSNLSNGEIHLFE